MRELNAMFPLTLKERIESIKCQCGYVDCYSDQEPCMSCKSHKTKLKYELFSKIATDIKLLQTNIENLFDIY